ncbi:MAG: hypothetical protein EOM54_05945 [Clostridia bacterium]|nr:hypothetical protein [Clostridia bacterium]NCC68847.1 hypothetical protein [Clostridia bacterium]
MDNEFSLIPSEARQIAAFTELWECNAFTTRFGLSLSDSQIRTLVESRFDALRATGRIEFGGGVLKKLIYAFCDSPFISQDNYEETLADLQEAFYYFKNESEDRFSDDELIGFMKAVFDGVAQGSLEYLSGTSLENLCRAARHETEGSEPDHDFLF